MTKRLRTILLAPSIFVVACETSTLYVEQGEDGTSTSAPSLSASSPPDCLPGTERVAGAQASSAVACTFCEAGTYCPGGDAPKTACPEGTWDHDGESSTACVPWSTCAPGEYVETLAGSATTNRSCKACSAGTFSDAPMASGCVEWSTCPAGTYVTGLATPWSNRTCAACPGAEQSAVENAATCGGPVVSVRANGNQTCAVMADGTVRCWGEDLDGGARVAPTVIPDVAGAIDVAPGSRHACAVLGDGTVRCWGNNREYQLGDGTTTSRSAALAVTGLTDAVQVSATGTMTVARRADGSVVMWGTHFMFMGGKEVFATPASMVLTGTIDVAVDSEYEVACSLMPGGKVRCADTVSNGYSRTWTVPGAKKIAGLAAYKVCVLDETGRLSCWTPRILGGVTMSPPPEDDKPELVPVLSAALDAAWNGTYFGAPVCIVAGGKVACASYKPWSEWAPWSSPAPVPGLTDVVAVTSGTAHTCALRADGTVYCWGENEHGQLGDGTTTQRLAPTAVVW